MRRLLFLIALAALAFSASAQDREPVEPVVECVIDFGNGQQIAVFNYNNPNASPVVAQSAAVNYLTPELPDADLPLILQPRVRPGVPNVTFEVPFTGDAITWTLFDQSVTASADSPACEVERPIEITVNPDVIHQTITGFGGAFVFRFSKTMDQGLADEVARINFETLDPTHMRFNMPLDQWEPENDDNDPRTTNFDAFVTDERIRTSFEYMQLAQEKGIVRHISVWAAPDWMVENPTRERERILKADMVDEFIESIVAYLLYAQAEYGVTLDTISLNEPDIGVFQTFTPQQQAEIILHAAERFAEVGIETRWAMGETSNMKGAIEYAQQVWETPDIPEQVAVWTYHSWDATVNDGILRENAAWAQEIDREVWLTEIGFDPEIYQTPEVFETFDFTIGTAQVYSRLYKLSGMNVPFYWQMIDDYRVISPDGETFFPTYYLLYGLRHTVPIGSVVIETSDDLASILSFAVQTPDGDFSLMVINNSTERQPLSITGLPDAALQHLRLSEGEMLEPVASLDTDEITMFLMARSINWFTTLELE